MGKKLDTLLRRCFNTGKLKANVNLSMSRLSVLKKQRQARCSIARSDVVELLNLGHHERALLRVDLLIKEQNMLDVFVLIEAYCHMLIDRIKLIQHEKTCPEELKEAISSLAYAASRCGDFPELQEIRAIFASRYGKEFVARAVELRNNCGVSPKMVTRLSSRMPSLENRLKMLKEIASENNIVLQLEEVVLERAEEKIDCDKKKDQPEQTNSDSFKMGGILPAAADFEKVEGFSDSMKVRKKYKNVADAAQAAFESAAYAASAARAAVELSRSDSHDPDDPNSPKQQLKGTSSTHGPVKSKLQAGEEKDLRDTEDQKYGMVFEKIHPMQIYSSESDEEGLPTEDKMEKFKQGKNEAEFKKSPSTSSSGSLDNISNETKMPLDEDLIMKQQERKIVFYDSDDEIVFDDSNDETRNTSRIFFAKNQ